MLDFFQEGDACGNKVCRKIFNITDLMERQMQLNVSCHFACVIMPVVKIENTQKIYVIERDN